jgi:hypothetical protein
MLQLHHRQHLVQVLQVSHHLPFNHLFSADNMPRSEASCLENCVDRFLDTSLYIVKQIEEQKSHLG